MTPDEYTTDDPAKVLPFIEHLAPEVRAFLEPDAKPQALPIITKPGAPDLLWFQREDVDYITTRVNTLLAEDAGLGKTAIMLTALNSLKVQSVLCITPAIAKYNWLYNEIPKWLTLTMSVHVVDGDNWQDADFVILNYDLLWRHKPRIQEREWDALICDESHKLNNSEAQRTVMVFGGAAKVKKDDLPEDFCGKKTTTPGKYKFDPIRAKRRIFASATPMNLPKDLWTICKNFDPQGLGSDWFYFHTRYCAAKREYGVWDIKGATNLKELNARLRDVFMCRHEEPIKLPDFAENVFILPPISIVLDIEEQFVSDNIDALMALSGGKLSKDASPQQFMELIAGSLVDNLALIGKPEFKPLFSKFAEVRRATGLAKVPHVIEFIKEKAAYQPVVCFGYHRAVMEALRSEFPDASFIVGGIDAEKRAAQVKAFQDGETNVFLGNIDAAGEAITLTRGNYACFAETDWRGTALIQARKRVHRLTQERAVRIDYLCAANSFDAYVAERAVTKIKAIYETISGKV